MKSIFSICLAIGLSSAFNASAATIYSQTTPSEPFAAFSSADFPISQKSADNFLIDAAEPVTVRSLRFIGSTGVVTPTPDVFRVVFLEDAGGLPGAPLVGGDFDIGSPYSREPTGGPLLNGVTTPHEYIVNVPGGLVLSPGTIYWLSITNTPQPNLGWVWARADSELDQLTAATSGSVASGPWNTFETGGMWFELNDQTIPEPSSLLLLLASLCSTVVARSRQCNQASISPKI
ncbi:PEP-CTERM sorting domain-containing protein [Adhaeretor mobilis]|uniref:PEP-CTERM protein-sorting domain-containing protein n=1 Tax=Adhaeretor mobilis TaxID=1930276 RepID=A0A517N260_9BACT|nr:PEP-CTERM sorting domain-containing protein [Adhaeretor mobilis]QDT01222.1 hypothetical protein HG15A2_45640 [Adhaeretor mobilis]